jgi:curved DNA-binding protein CbpA
MAELDPVFEIEAQALAGIVDQLDYFQILKIEQSVGIGEIKEAYFRESRLYHPDRYFGLPEGELKSAVSKIYKRINEAWVCLRDDRKRDKYVSDISGPDREKKLRYTDVSEEELKKARDAEMGTTPQGKKMFQAGLLDLESGRYTQAAQNFKMALMYEPANVLFKQKQDESLKLASGKK